MKYYQAENTGIGFITHEDNELAHVAGYPANIWVTENIAWAERVDAVEKTKEEAQALIDTAIAGQTYPEAFENAGQQVVVTLP
jgi:hypothetical protein